MSTNTLIPDNPVGEVNVRWFMRPSDTAAPGNTEDHTQAFVEAQRVLETDDDFRGGVLYAPRGVYHSLAPLDFVAGGSSDTAPVHNITVRGDGPLATFIDFSGCPDGADGVRFGKGTHFGLRDLCIARARRHGVALVGGALGSDDFLAQGAVRNCRIQLSGGNGFKAENVFMLSLDECWSWGNGGAGYALAGMHTSVHASRCWASGNANGPGWSLNGIVYGAFDALGSDDNRWGYALSNCQAVDMRACGAERSGFDSWLVRTSNALSANVLDVVQDIKGLTLRNCYAIDGNQLGTPGYHASFLAAIANDNRAMSMKLDSCVAYSRKYDTGMEDPSVVLNGNGGRITLVDDACVFDSPSVRFGDVVYKVR